MKNLQKLMGLLALVMVLLIASYYIGKNSGKKSVEYVTETITKYDTVTKVIKVPEKIVKDTIIYVDLPAKIDTVYVIKDYFSKRYKERQFSDSNIVITVKDTINRNDIESGSIQYKWLQPTTVINKTSTTTNYYKYLSAGLSSQTGLKSFEINILYQTRRYYYTVGYDPIMKITRAGIGTTIFKFK